MDDYVKATATKLFFSTVQNKFHWAIHGKTAAELIYKRADAEKNIWDLRVGKMRQMAINRFIEATDRDVLQDAGKVTAEIAKAHAESEFEKYRIVQDQLFKSDFDRLLEGAEEE